MRFTTISTILAFGSLASASVLPRMLDAYDLAQPVVERTVQEVVERKVPTLQCDLEPMYIGQLKLVSNTNKESPVAFEGLRDANGYQMLDVQANGVPARYENFAFTTCNSTFMGYTDESGKAAEIYFGRLQPAHLQGKRCVASSVLGDNNARFIADVCSDSDDSGQLTQFWSLTKQPAANGNDFTYYVNFLGAPAKDDAAFAGSYILHKTMLGSSKLIRLSYSKVEGKVSKYFLKLA